MRSLSFGVLCFSFGFLLSLTACKNQNGTGGNAGPVSNSLDSTAGTSGSKGTDTGKSGKADPGLISRLNKVRDRESRPQGLVEPLFQDRAPEWGVDFSLYRDAVKDRFFFS